MKKQLALVIDLKQRGMLGETIVHWGGEIGRLPVTQNQGGPEKDGRDHNGAEANDSMTYSQKQQTDLLARLSSR